MLVSRSTLNSTGSFGYVIVNGLLIVKLKDDEDAHNKTVELLVSPSLKKKV